MPTKDYTYAVARVRSRESRLLSNSFLQQLLSWDYDSCIRALLDYGWGEQSADNDSTHILSIEHDKLWRFVHELAGDDKALNVFLLQNDFHNLKVAVKTTVRQLPTDNLLIDNGTVSSNLICNAVRKLNYDALPDYLGNCAKKAMSTLLSTSDGQLCDSIIDKACLEKIYATALSVDIDVVSRYAELYVAFANIKIALRCAQISKPKDFVLSAMSNCDSLDISVLANASSVGVDDVIEYISDTAYKSAISSISNSMSGFEKWCDDFILSELQTYRWDPFSIAPLVGYIVARENEIKSVRIILSGKLNNIDTHIIKERLRKSYA